MYVLCTVFVIVSCMGSPRRIISLKEFEKNTCTYYNTYIQLKLQAMKKNHVKTLEKKQFYESR